MHPAFASTAHRPWGIPTQPWAWRQSWRDLLFAHWPVPAEILRPWVPPALNVQQFGGTSWIGVVPFHMTGVMRRPLPDLPGLSAFPELNVRLYVEYQGKPRVWFLSLDATNPFAVWAARRFFYLPYYRAGIQIAQVQTPAVTPHQTPEARATGGAFPTFRYRSKRRGSSPARELQASYGPLSAAYALSIG